MRKISALLLVVLLMAGLCPAVLSPVSAAAGSAGKEFRGVWVSSVINLDYPSAEGLSASALAREADAILNNAAALGFTAVILQVRPTGDALYSSAIFPWSNFVSGTQGVAPDDGFDPLAYFVEGAHQRGLELHAWLNPFRIARNADSVDNLADSNPAKQHPEWVVAHTDGHLYYDPGIPEVRQLIIDGVAEIVENYPVDGIHFDDYFYPGKSFSDAGTYAAHGGGLSIEDWRRDNVNKLVYELGKTIHNIDAQCRFGISPQAIWAHLEFSPYGSDTAITGNQTFHNQYADTRKWVLSGWIDYVAPQIYWEIGHERSDYETLLKWWCGLVRDTEVDLYIGHATYQLNGYGSAEAWKGTDEILRQIDMARSYKEYKGSLHFRYKFLAEDAAIAAAVKLLHGDSVRSVSNDIRTVMPSIPKQQLVVGRPAKDTTVSFNHFYIVGASDPSLPLMMNGAEVTNRSKLGYFAVYVDLKSGENRFTFTQGPDSLTRIITVASGGGGRANPTEMSRGEILPGSAFPELYDEVRTAGDSITLRCTAPIGAEVSVRVSGRSFTMKPDRTDKPSDGRIYATSYSVSYTLPPKVNHQRIADMGAPVYTMRYEGQSMSRRATASLLCVGAEAPLFAEVISDVTFVYPNATTSGGPTGELLKGQRDYLRRHQSGQWVMLGSGGWVQRSDLRLYTGNGTLSANLGAVSYTVGERWDSLHIETDVPGVTGVVWNGKSLVFTLYNVRSAPVASLPSGAMMHRVTALYDNGKAVYTLTPKDGVTLNGYYTELTDKGIVLHCKPKPQIRAGDKPLEGFSIVVDAGHGGDDSGAPGVLGYNYAEETINLYAALKLSETLRSLGADVSLTRSTDAETGIQSRLNLSRSIRPDLFISLHCNSMEYDVNSDEIRGLAVFYREPLAEDFAKSIYQSVWKSLGIGHKGCHKSNLYVCRGFWAPSVIVEMGFMNNPHDYEWLTSNEEQNKLITAITDGIVQYFN